MALPSSGPISGSQIWEEVNGSITDPPPPLSLGGMIESSSIANTNPDSYSEFYGYSGGRETTYGSSAVVGKPAGACTTSGVINTLRYHNGSPGLPASGDTMYTSATGDNYLGAGNWSIRPNPTFSGLPFIVITVTGTSGLITSVTNCVV